jgi:hypothetical protein
MPTATKAFARNAGLTKGGTMAVPWVDYIKSRKTLEVFAGQSVSGAWMNVFNEVILRFNNLALGVTLIAGTNVNQPDPDNLNGADVWLEVSPPTFATDSTAKKFKVNGQEVTATCGPRIGGNTKWIRRDVNGSPGPLLKACILMKTLNTKSGGVVRVMGAGVLKCNLFHELIHACGLAESEHTFDDIFSAVLTPQAMSNPQDDHVESITSRKMPPAFFNGNTVNGIAKNWT